MSNEIYFEYQALAIFKRILRLRCFVHENDLSEITQSQIFETGLRKLELAAERAISLMDYDKIIQLELEDSHEKKN